MLHLNLENAGEDFLIQIKKMHEFFKKMLTELELFSFKNSRDQLLIYKQIERLEVFLKEMNLHVRGFHTKPPPDEREIIFIFERQHLFKNIFRKTAVNKFFAMWIIAPLIAFSLSLLLTYCADILGLL